MQSNKLLKAADKILKRDSAVFDALMEFEETKKVRTKERLTFTINKGMASRFRKFCKNKGYNMSAKIEQAMEKIMEEK